MDPLSRLARTAAAGDRRAVAAFVEAAYDEVWRLCAALVDRQSADDLAQEAILKAVRALPGYRADAAARTWLLAITRYTCLDELRLRYRRERDARLSSATAVESKPTTSDASEDLVVRDLLAELEPDRRTAFVLTQTFGLTYDEAATVCGCPVGTIRSRVARARSDLLNAIRSAEQTGEEPAGNTRSDTA